MFALEGRASRLLQIGDTFYFESEPWPDLAEERLGSEGKRMLSRALVFLLAMAAASVAREVGHWLIRLALLVWFGLTLDPFMLSVALQLVVTLFGIGVACRLSKVMPGSTARWHMLLTPVAALGISLILAWLGHLIGYTNALNWPVVLVYLLWAWATAVSSA